MIDAATDIPFSVPFVHRLRVTSDVANQDFHALLGVLHAEESSSVRVVVIAEKAVARLSDRVERISSQLASTDRIERVCPIVLIEGGEAVKNSQAVVQQILSTVNEGNLDRRSYVIAIGGGAMLDAVGFAVAIAHRGIRLVRIPTTTLAQADSGVGVKNAINYFGKKNWVGTFAVPWAVINDTTLLHTLSDRDYVSGFSEAVKVALLKDRNEFDWLCTNANAIAAREDSVSTRAIFRSCQLHLQHITNGGDPFEMLEARPLDFGHWSAHRLEALTNYEIRHGEAVAIGVAIDCLYSVEKLGFPLQDAMRAIDCLRRLQLPLWHSALEPMDRIIEGLEEFRQHLGGRLTVTMLNGIAESVNVHEMDVPLMQHSIQALKKIAKDL
ncbi:3-dehydroquinate synthase [Novipirellula aureliae]|uniref:3-dehydroquinate synthase n=1 Tax=Novipirellula aureliae TaxID=2527966 RepID=A0A5C6EAX9_9BACT|nr:3-dehydroquinate synthase [Novipirellula aureliae]TWU44891.1 3-dehydroquinate synthase [Novipirellula aureliae]